MRIIFNLLSTGLGNNGGSMTIVKSANTLVDLGHEVIILDSVHNQHTWNKLKAEHLIYDNLTSVPEADCVLATGFRTVKSTANFPKSVGIKFHWIRGWETWVYSENIINEKILSANVIKLVNSVGLQDKLKKYNIDSYIVRPGYDFEDFRPLGLRGKKEIVLGGLYHTKHKTKRSDWCFKIFNDLKKKYNIKLMMFGINSGVKTEKNIEYFNQPDIKTKNELFNKTDIWLSPSILEGLHIVPAEAMLTECCVVGVDSELCGTKDYLYHKRTGLVSEDNYLHFKNCVEYLINEKEEREKLGKCGRKLILELGDRKENMKKFVSLVEKFKEVI